MLYLLEETINTETDSFNYVTTFDDYTQAIDYACMCEEEATDADEVALYAMDNYLTYEIPITY